MWETEATIEGPYQFKRALKRAAADPTKKVMMEHVSITVSLLIDGEAYAIAVEQIGASESPVFRVRGNVPTKHEEKAFKEIERMFQWKVPFQKITDHFQGTDLAQLFAKLAGTPLILDVNLYFSLMKAIIHQQLNLTFSRRLTARFVHTFGFQKDGVWFPPSAETISRLNHEDLTALQFSGRKAEYIIDASKRIAAGKLPLHTLHALSNESIVAALTKFRGIGPWTAESVLLFGMGRPSVFPYADIGLQNALKKWYQLEEKPTREQMEKWRTSWSPYETYAALYMWEFLKDPSLAELQRDG